MGSSCRGSCRKCAPVRCQSKWYIEIFLQNNTLRTQSLYSQRPADCELPPVGLEANERRERNERQRLRSGEEVILCSPMELCRSERRSGDTRRPSSLQYPQKQRSSRSQNWSSQVKCTSTADCCFPARRPQQLEFCWTIRFALVFQCSAGQSANAKAKWLFTWPSYHCSWLFRAMLVFWMRSVLSLPRHSPLAQHNTDTNSPPRGFQQLFVAFPFSPSVVGWRVGGLRAEMGLDLQGRTQRPQQLQRPPLRRRESRGELERRHRVREFWI